MEKAFVTPYTDFRFHSDYNNGGNLGFHIEYTANRTPMSQTDGNTEVA